MSIDNSLQLANDQLASQFEFQILSGPAVSTNAGGLITFRMDGDFDPPEEVVGTYDIVYRGQKTTKTNMTEQTTKEFTTAIRIDQKWEAYKALKAWKTAVYDANNGVGGGNTGTSILGTIAIAAFDHTGARQKTFKFIDSRPKSIKVETFSNGSEDPSRVTVIFIYRQMEES
jgi:hypothetical protein